MSWRATLFWSFLAALVGFGLFHVKYQVQALEDRLAKVNRDIVREQAQIHVLRGEWAYLNRPERIEELASRHLALVPPKATQIGSIADLPMRPAAEDTPDVVASHQPAKTAPVPSHRMASTPLAIPVAAAPDAYALRALMNEEHSSGIPDETATLPAGGR